MNTVADRDTAVGRRAIDELLEGYVSWREECQAVALSYGRLIASGCSERRLVYARISQGLTAKSTPRVSTLTTVSVSGGSPHEDMLDTRLPPLAMGDEHHRQGGGLRCPIKPAKPPPGNRR